MSEVVRLEGSRALILEAGPVTITGARVGYRRTVVSAVAQGERAEPKEARCVTLARDTLSGEGTLEEQVSAWANETLRPLLNALEVLGVGGEVDRGQITTIQKASRARHTHYTLVGCKGIDVRALRGRDGAMKLSVVAEALGAPHPHAKHVVLAGAVLDGTPWQGMDRTALGWAQIALAPLRDALLALGVGGGDA